jgi:putative flippase GtrA
MINFSPRTKRELVRFLKFCVVGVIGAVVDFGTFNLLANIIGIWSVLASMMSFTAAVISNFLWNRYWTYPDSRSKKVSSQALQFAIVSAIGLAIRTPLFAFTEPALIRLSSEWIPRAGEILTRLPDPIEALSPVVIGRNLALALAVVVVLFWNFGINRFWTYSDVE